MGYNKQFFSRALNANSESAPQDLAIDMSLFAIQLLFTGATCSFSAKLQVSNDGTTFDDYPNSSQTFTSAGSFTYNVFASGFAFVKLVITDNSSGSNTGKVFATINSKGPF